LEQRQILNSEKAARTSLRRKVTDQLGGEVGVVLAGCRGLVAVIWLAVTVLPLAVPLTCTVLPTGNCCAVPGVRLVPN
jgi:hypothetical protein